MKYFIVEDYPEMRKLIRKYIEKTGDTVIEFDDGSEVVEAYGKYHPDWVLMDIEMKGTNGLDTTKTLKEKYPEAQVVILTQHDDKFFRKRAEELHTHGYFLKDNLEKLYEFIRRGK